MKQYKPLSYYIDCPISLTTELAEFSNILKQHFVPGIVFGHLSLFSGVGQVSSWELSEP